MAPCIQRGVGQHGNADKLDFIQNAVGIVSAAAASARFTVLIDMKTQLVYFITAHRCNSSIGANHRTHAASHTGVCRVCALVNPVINGNKVA